MGDKDCFSKVCVVDSSRCCLWADENLDLSLVVKNPPSLPGRQGVAERSLCVSVAFQLPLALNNSYVGVANFGVAYSERLYC